MFALEFQFFFPFFPPPPPPPLFFFFLAKLGSKTAAWCVPSEVIGASSANLAPEEEVGLCPGPVAQASARTARVVESVAHRCPFWLFSVVLVENSMAIPGLAGGLIVYQHLFPLKGRPMLLLLLGGLPLWWVRPCFVV